MKGRVLWYDDFRKFGFIIDIDTNDEYFFHITAVDGKRVLYKDDKVEFEIEDSPKGGKRCAKVKFVSRE